MINYWFKEARKWKTLCKVISIAYQQRRILKNRTAGLIPKE